jgi:hypothetical protein
VLDCSESWELVSGGTRRFPGWLQTGAGAGGSGGPEGLQAGVSISISREASWLEIPARREVLGARVSIAMEGIEGLKSFYEGIP